MTNEATEHSDEIKGGSIRRREVPKKFGSAFKKAATGRRSIHPAIISGISYEDTQTEFVTRRGVFVTALILAIGVITWAAIAPENINAVGTTMQSWVVQNLGWLYGALVVVAAIFMVVVGYGPTGKIKLGTDDSEPDFSTMSWISMLFAAGLGIGLIFYGPLEPLSHFLTPPPATDAEPGSMDAVAPALSQSILHQASLAWVIYALVGGSLAYSAFRRGRLPLISTVFEPVFPDGSNRVLGKTIDIATVLVTLFGTATSLGIGALQIRTGASIFTGEEIEGNGFVVVAISILTVIFIISAVTGVKRGIMVLSNINMGLVIGLALFVLVVGPTVFLLDLVPTSLYTFVGTFTEMMSVHASQGEVEAEFVTAWTMLYWAWRISWSPFVGMFVAKISKGRTLREFVTVTIFVPAGISALWYVIFGGTAIHQSLSGEDISVEGAGENVMFDLVGNPPFGVITSALVLIAILIFFVTAADSATLVMSSMSQSGRPVPARPVTITWGVALGHIAMFLLLAGGRNSLSGLQAIMVSCSLPFVIVLIGMMVSWAVDLRNDPVMIRRSYAKEAIDRGAHRGIDKHGDDFVFGTAEVASGEGAGADFESDDPTLSEWYTTAAEAAADDESSTTTPEEKKDS